MRERAVLFLISRLGALFILLVGITWRLQIFGDENVQGVWARGKNVIYAFWHGRMLALCYSHRRQNIHIMVSEHRDGEIIARIVRLLGFVPVRGSTTRGGLKALFQIAGRIGTGKDVAITPDGPKGPRWRVQPGVIALAQRTGMPIIPAANGVSFGKIVLSWDRFVIPMPFSRVAVLLGSPIYVPRKICAEDVEAKRVELEKALQELTHKADNLFQKTRIR